MMASTHVDWHVAYLKGVIQLGLLLSACKCAKHFGMYTVPILLDCTRGLVLLPTVPTSSVEINCRSQTKLCCADASPLLALDTHINALHVVHKQNSSNRLLLLQSWVCLQRSLSSAHDASRAGHQWFELQGTKLMHAKSHSV